MPLYKFNIIKDGHERDTVGVELASLDVAQTEAARLMGEELRFKPDELWSDQDWSIEVTDEAGLILFTVFSSAVESAATPRKS